MKLLLFTFSILLAYISIAQSDQVGLWQPVTDHASSKQSGSVQTIPVHQKAISGSPNSDDRQYRVDALQLKQVLARAGYEGRASSASEISLPVENGEIQRFSLVESPIMAPELAARYPEIKTYKIHGIDNPAARGRLSISSKGFHAMVSSSSGTFYIDPVADDVYRSYSRRSQSTPKTFNCGVKGHDHATPAGRLLSHSANRTAGSLQVYRLAVAATAEYVSAVGSSVTAAQAEIVVAINRVNEIYERDLGIRLELVAGNNTLLYQNPTTDPYTNSDGTAMLDQNQTNIDTVIGTGAYDIGHVFSTGGGGIAAVGSVCDNTVKAQGVTGLPDPRGEAFYIDFVAHEIGHQFNADHSFNGSTNSCLGGRVQAVAFEPGSGSTIMSYAGICGDENITSNTDAMFGAGSINQIDAFTTSGRGNSCGSNLAISNANEPTANAGNDFTIPHKTPFMLTASGSDLDNDPLTYSWDQMDAGTATTVSNLGFDLGNNSLFRSYLPRPENYRHFPAMDTTLQNKFDDSEVLACQTRTLNFRLTVRDGKSGISQDDVVISVDNNSGPFAITAFNSAQTITPGSYTLTWDVAGTDQAPVNCSQVDISLLTFNAGKATYSETLLASNEANDGSTAITIPSQSSNSARLKVKCSNNIFYDISDADLAITATTPFNTSGNKVFNNSNGLVSFDAPAEVCISNDESNISFASAATISFDIQQNYSLQTTIDEDYFQVTVATNGRLSIQTSGNTDTECRLYEETNTTTPLVVDNDTGDLLNCLITQDVSPGVYFIRVGGSLGATGDYGLTVSILEDEANGAPNTAATISFDIQQNYSLQTTIDEDYFQVTVATNGRLSIQTSGNTDTECMLYEETNTTTPLVVDNDTGDLLNCLITQDVSPGVYFIRVGGSLGAIGDYGLIVSILDTVGTSDISDTNTNISGGGSGFIDIWWLFWMLSLQFLGKFYNKVRGI